MSHQCFHCQLPVTQKNRVITDINHQQQEFCCHGCASVCKTIHEAGLSSFYNFQETGLLPKIDLEFSSEIYDSDVFQNSYLEQNDNGIKSLTLISETIHCAACVWLLEKAIGSMKGVENIRVSLTDQRVKIVWNDEIIQLSAIAKRMADLGYNAIPYERNLIEHRERLKNKQMLYRIGFSGFTMMNLLWISIALYTGADDGKYKEYFEWLGFLLATPTLFYSGFPFLKNAYIGLKNFQLNMDLPISIGALTTYLYSTLVLFGFGNGGIYFDTVVNFIFVILIGRYFESLGKRQAITASSSLKQLQPKIALVEKHKKETIMPINAVKSGEIVVIRPGEIIPIDGEVISGTTEVDESLISGESTLINKTPGDKVLSGTVNMSGSLKIKVSKSVNESALNQIINLVNDAGVHKSKIVCTIDRFIPYFVLSTLGLALLSFVYWLPEGFDTSLMIATSVLIITCPCAFGLATPVSLSVASGIASKRKLLIKNTDAFEVANQITHVIFDKTGTLTNGRFQISKVVTGLDEKYFINLISSLESLSEHSIASAFPTSNNSEKLQVESFKSSPGRGIRGLVEGNEIRVGTYEFVSENITNEEKGSFPIADEDTSTILWCSDNKKILGYILLEDQIKSDAKILIDSLKSQGMNISILSGDKLGAVKNVADKLGINNYYAELIPSQKLELVKKIQKTDKVLMVGDGINDAPALIQSDLSIAVVGAADISAQQSDIVLIGKGLKFISRLFTISQFTKRVIKQNIYFAFGYNFIMIPLAMMGKITPLVAAIAMPISSIIVILNALRIKNKG
ncbi:MAG: heavy metal translocating P-type ATPase [Gammaproteobacteria bacterium]